VEIWVLGLVHEVGFEAGGEGEGAEGEGRVGEEEERVVGGGEGARGWRLLVVSFPPFSEGGKSVSPNRIAQPYEPSSLPAVVSPSTGLLPTFRLNAAFAPRSLSSKLAISCLRDSESVSSPTIGPRAGPVVGSPPGLPEVAGCIG
jgi:hypothetical protein